MRVLQNDLSDLVDFLQYEEMQGMKWLVFDENKPASEDNVYCLLQAKEALQVVRKLTNDDTNIKIVSLDAFSFALQEIDSIRMWGELKLPDEMCFDTNRILKNAAQTNNRLAEITIDITENELKQIDMNQKNLEHLANQLKYTGFPDGIMEKVKENISKGLEEFTVPHTQEYGRNHTSATLDFKKSSTTDNYFFNKYHMQLQVPGNEDMLQYSFYINMDQKNITHKEAYNLLSGRAVHKELAPKEGGKYNAWLQLDVKNPGENGELKLRTFHPNYGYDLLSVLDNRPIKELAESESKKELIKSLERGNRQQVTFKQGDKEVKAFIEAAPQFKSLNYYAEDHKRMDYQQIKSALEPAAEKSVKNKHTQKQQQDPGDDDEGAPKKRKGKKQSV